MADETKWTLEQIRTAAVEVIWPLLKAGLDSVSDKISAAPLVVLGGPVISSAGTPTTVRIPIQFSTNAGTEGQYIGEGGSAGALGDAAFLFRAYGGERIKRFTLSGTLSEGSVTIRIQRTDYTRMSTADYPGPLDTTLTFSAPVQTLELDQSLEPGDCIVATYGTSFSGFRIDGTLLIEVSNEE